MLTKLYEPIAIQKILGVTAIIFGLYSILNSVAWYYRYSDPGTYWFYMIPAYKLFIGLVLGLISLLNGLLLLRHKKGFYFKGSIISIGLIILHWLLFVSIL